MNEIRLFAADIVTYEHGYTVMHCPDGQDIYIRVGKAPTIEGSH